MCGFAGFLDPRGLEPGSGALVRAMADRLMHRGPDDAGTWLDARDGIAFGHRRLAVLDLSPTGRQPMWSPSGRFVIAFNGEIYDHLELREALGADAPPWRGTSDTETLLGCIDCWGIERTLQRVTGMFAFALWDTRLRRLTLARDRLGEKPCYFGWQNGVFLFASELKALRPHPAFAGELAHGSLASFLRHGYVPTPHSIFAGISKLPPGCVLDVDHDVGAGHEATVRAYWTLADVADAGRREPFVGSDEEAVDELERLLGRAVALQRVADVPLGAFLSGGIDSSTVVALMQRQATRPIRTFTIGFDMQGYDESEHARAVARHLGTEHTELRVTAAEASDVIRHLPSLYDEPFADASAVPTYLVTRLAREHVTVALSGDGGDELFGGYLRYRRTRAAWRALSRVPGLARPLAIAALSALPAGAIEEALIAGRVGRFPHLFRNRRDALRAGLRHGVAGLYRHQMSLWVEPNAVLRQPAVEPSSVLIDDACWMRGVDPLEQLMDVDTRSYLPDDVLVKVDRAAMAVSLETRVPLLDHRVIAFAWRLPLDLRLRGNEGKWLLRQLLARYVPKQLVDRPKMGFGVPIDAWLRGPLRAWAEDLLDSAHLDAQGLFNPVAVRRLWRQHVVDGADRGLRLWPLLVAQEWLRHQSI